MPISRMLNDEYKSIDLAKYQNKFDFQSLIECIDYTIMGIKHEDKLFYTTETDYGNWIRNVYKLLKECDPDLEITATRSVPYVGVLDIDSMPPVAQKYNRYNMNKIELVEYWTKISRLAIILIDSSIGPWHIGGIDNAYEYLEDLRAKNMIKTYIGIGKKRK